MSSVQARRGQEQLEPLRTTRSFSRFDPGHARRAPDAAKTNHEARARASSKASESKADLFERKDETEASDEDDIASPQLGEEDFEGLPEEIKSLIERLVIQSLQEKGSNLI